MNKNFSKNNKISQKLININKLIVYILFICSTKNCFCGPNAAIVNNEPIPKSQVDIILEKYGQPTTNKAIRNQVREMMINRVLITQEAKKYGIDKNPEAKLQIEQSNATIYLQYIFPKYLENGGVTNEDYKKAYESIKGQLRGTEYNVKHILLETEKSAQEYLTKLQEGKSFAELAKSSKDIGSASKGGELGWVHEKSLVPEFAKVLPTLKIKSYSKPIKTQFGWHIIEVLGSRPAVEPPFSELKPQLLQVLMRNEAYKKAKFTEMMKILREKAKIE